MMRLAASVAAVCLGLTIAAAQAPDPSHPDQLLWPKPQSFSADGNTYSVDSTMKFVATGNTSDYLTQAFSRYKAILFPAGKAFRTVGPSTTSLTQVEVDVLSADLTLSQATSENYTLHLSAPTTTITADTVYGAIRALETFSQLVTPDGAGGLLAFGATVSDFPRFSHRGMMIDTARHFQNLNLIKFNIDVLAQNKFNVLHWHIVDDQSFPYTSTSFPNMTMGAYNYPSTNHIYTQDDVKTVIEYAKARGIRVIVEFDTPGHTRAWGAGHPELLTECYSGGHPDGSYGPMNPTVNSTFDFLKTFMAEVATVFPDHYIHVGGDEVSFSCWQSNPAVQAWMKARGWTDYALLEQYYEQNLLDIVNALNKGYICWQEIFDNGLKIRADTVVDVWKGGWQDEMAKVTAAGYKTILSSPFYLNYISYGEDWNKYYLTEPLNFTGTAEQKELVIGVEMCLWAEYIDSTNFMSRAWPRSSAVGERMWSAESVRDMTDATARMHNHRCRMIRRGIPAEPPSGPSYCPTEFPTVSPPWVA